jgi:hypothetical protein
MYRRVSVSPDVGNALLLLRFLRRARSSWQLQYACTLTYAEMREQHDLAIGELKGIMVRAWIVHVDLPEPSHLVTDVLRFPLEKAQLKSRNHTLDFALERDLGARKKAHGHLGFPNGAKPARRGIPKFRRDQLVSDRSRSGRNSVQTVVAHGRESPILAVPRQPIPLLVTKKVMTKS